LRLCETIGGQRFYLTDKPPAAFVEVLGQEAAELVHKALPRKYFELPRCAHVPLAARNRELRRLALAGVPHAELARRYGLTRRRLRKLVALKSQR